MSKLQEIFGKKGEPSFLDKHTFSKMIENPRKNNLQNDFSIKGNLKKIVKEKNPIYFFESSQSNNYNLKSMKANYLLALTESRQGNNLSARGYFKEAVRQFKQMAKHKVSSLPKYIEKNSFNKFYETERKTEKELNNYKRKLSQIGKEIEIPLEESLDLAFIKTSKIDKKYNLFYKFF